MYYVGIDWADRSHRVCVLDEDAEVATEFDMPHSQDGFRVLEASLRKLANDPGQIAIVCETKHNLLINFLGSRDYLLYVVNPKALDRFRDTKRASNSKSDRFDAFCLADFLKTNIETLRPLEKDDEGVRRAGGLYRFRSRLVRNKVAIQNTLVSELKTYYPRATELFGIDTTIFAAFLNRYPTPSALGEETEEGFIAFTREMRYPCHNKVRELAKAATKEQIEVDKCFAKEQSFCVLMLLEQLELVVKQIREVEKSIKVLVSEYQPARLLNSIPGAGEVISAGIIAGLGDVGRYGSASAVQCIAGTAPVTRQSGNYKYVVMRKSCNRHLRSAFQYLALGSIRNSSWANDYYQQQRTRGKRHHQALRALANKWAGIAYAMLRDNQMYDEDYNAIEQEGLRQDNELAQVG